PRMRSRSTFRSSTRWPTSRSRSRAFRGPPSSQTGMGTVRRRTTRSCCAAMCAPGCARSVTNTTVSDYSTPSTIERPPRPEGDRPSTSNDGARPRLAAIVASLHGRTGKTLFARVLADYFLLSGLRPFVFDTDFTEQTLRNSFPSDAVVADLSETRDQMMLFDTIAARSPEARVVDVSHYVFRKFFKVMQEIDFVREARARLVEPVIFYIAGRNPDAYEEGRLLRERFPDCALVLVENVFLGAIKERTLHSAGYRAFESHDLCMMLPLLDPALADAIQDGELSLSDLIRQPLSRSDTAASGGFSFEQRAEMRGWL